MRLADYRVLGMLPLQDHRELLLQNKTKVMVGRVEARVGLGDYQIEGHGDSESPVMTSGDLRSAYHWPNDTAEKRQHGSWFFVSAAIATSSSEKDSGEDEGEGLWTGGEPGFEQAPPTSTTRTRGQQDKDDARNITVLPVFDAGWKEDDRYEEVKVSLHPDSPDVVKGAPVLVLATSDEAKQELLGFSLGGSALIAVNNAGDPEKASLVYDLNDEDELDDTRKAKLHAFFRVLQLTGNDGGLAWQFMQATQDGIDGRGYVCDTAGAASVGSPEAEDEGGVPSQGEVTQVGGVTFVDEYLKKQRDDYKAKTRPHGPGAPTDQGGPVSPDTPAARSTAAYIVASMTARAGGPIEVGDANDPHHIGQTLDGIPIKSAHIHCNALFKNKVGDGPLEFDVQAYEEPTLAGPFLSPVHLRWDPGTPHEFGGNVGQGKWRWEAETFFLIPEDRRTTTTIGGFMSTTVTETWIGPEETGPGPGGGDPDTVSGPGGVNECQQVPGGGGTKPLTGAGGGTGGPGTGGWTPPTSYPGGNGPGSNTGAPGGAVSPGGYPSGPPTSTQQADPILVTPAGGGPYVDGFMVPGGGGTVGDSTTKKGPKEPGRAAEKVGGDSATGYDDVGRGGQAGGETVPNIRDTDIPLGGLSVFGGGALSADVHYALRSANVIDAYGRPCGIPAPRVGDSIATRRQRGGGKSTRTPTSLQTMGFGGGLQLRPAATADGQTDFTNGGWIQQEVHVPSNAGAVAGLNVYGAGDGTWEALTRAGGGGGTVSGGVVWGPPEITHPENMAALLSGTLGVGTQGEGSLGEGAVDVFFPGGMSNVVFGEPRAGGAGGFGATRLRQTIFGLQIDGLTSTGQLTGVGITLGEAGVTITAPKTTITGRLDPTTVELTDVGGAGTLIPGGGNGLELRVAVDPLRPLWTDPAGTRTPLALQPLTGIVTNWRNVWVLSTYEKGDMVRDGDWLMVANTPTTDRAAPQEDDNPLWTLPDVPAWTAPDPDYLGVVESGSSYDVTQPITVVEYQVWVPLVSANHTYTIRTFSYPIGDPAAIAYRGITVPALVAGQWTTVASERTIVGQGTTIGILLQALNSGANSVVGPFDWGRAASSNTGEPPVGDWNRTNINTLVRISKTDDTATDRTASLTGVIAGATIQIVNKVDANQSITYTTTTSEVDRPTSFEWGVLLENTGSGGEPPVGAVCVITITVPVPSATDYVELPGGASPNGTGILRFDGVDQVGDANAYGVRVLWDTWTVSPDWDYANVVGSGGGGGGGGDTGTTPALEGVLLAGNLTGGTAIQASPASTVILADDAGVTRVQVGTNVGNVTTIFDAAGNDRVTVSGGGTQLLDAGAVPALEIPADSTVSPVLFAQVAGVQLSQKIGDEIATPANPVAGHRKIYAKGDGWYDLDSAGIETPLVGAPVDSVFSRTGVVVAVLNDYAASLVDNDSTVTGATVKDALETLEAAIPPAFASPLTTKGDVFGYDTGDARIPVGANGEVLTANSALPLGVEWAAGGGGGGGSPRTLVGSGSQASGTSLTIPIPGNTVSKDGDFLQATVWFQTAGTSATFTIRYGNQGPQVAMGANQLHGQATYIMARRGASSQSMSMFAGRGSSGTAFDEFSAVNKVIDMTAAQDLIFRFDSISGTAPKVFGAIVELVEG